MTGRDRKRRIAGTLGGTAIFAALCLSAGALAADRTDPSFGTGGVVEVPLPAEAKGELLGIKDLANAPGGLVAAVGDVGPDNHFFAARFNRDGAIDTTFGTGGFTAAFELSRRPSASEIAAQAEAVAVARNGKVIVAGYQEDRVYPSFAPILIRYRRNGSLDQSFGHGGKVTPRPPSIGRDPGAPFKGGDTLHDVAIAPSGRIVVAGARNEISGGRPAGLVIAYRPDGAVDRSFGKAGRVLFPANRDEKYTALRSVEVIGGDRTLVSGYRHNRLFLARLTPDGRLDPRFGGGDGQVGTRIEPDNGCFRCRFPGAMAIDRGGRILVLVERTVHTPLLARFLPDGRLDRSFGRQGIATARAGGLFANPDDLALQGDQRIVVTGFESRTGANGLEFSVFSALRFLPDGRLDRGFGEGGVQALETERGGASYAALTQPNGRVVAGGVAFEDPAGSPAEAKLVLTRYR
jgi:uncharacterized delta-60 repeat protein